MNLTPVVSSTIAALAYDAGTETLTVRFLPLPDGPTYEYYRVGALIAHQLYSAPSVGKAFHALIRDRFPCRKIEDPT